MKGKTKKTRWKHRTPSRSWSRQRFLKQKMPTIKNISKLYIKTQSFSLGIYRLCGGVNGDLQGSLSKGYLPGLLLPVALSPCWAIDDPHPYMRPSNTSRSIQPLLHLLYQEVDTCKSHWWALVHLDCWLLWSGGGNSRSGSSIHRWDQGMSWGLWSWPECPLHASSDVYLNLCCISSPLPVTWIVNEYT